MAASEAGSTPAILQALGQAARPEPGVDEDAGLPGFHQGRIARAARPQHPEAKAHGELVHHRRGADTKPPILLRSRSHTST